MCSLSRDGNQVQDSSCSKTVLCKIIKLIFNIFYYSSIIKSSNMTQLVVRKEHFKGTFKRYSHKLISLQKWQISITQDIDSKDTVLRKMIANIFCSQSERGNSIVSALEGEFRSRPIKWAGILTCMLMTIEFDRIIYFKQQVQQQAV